MIPFLYNGLRWLAGDTDQAVDSEPIVMRSNQPRLPCEMFYLSAADPEIVAQVLATKVRLEKTWHRFASRTGFDTIGQLGERIVRQAFEAAPDLFYVAPGWGDVRRVNGIDIPASNGPVGSVDGLVMLTSVPPAQGQAIIAVKNQREWLYPRDPDLWDIIRNGFAVGAVPVIFARKIYSSAFTYVLSRVGGIGNPNARAIRPSFCADRFSNVQRPHGSRF